MRMRGRSELNVKSRGKPRHAFGLTAIQIARTSRRLLRWGRRNFKNYPWRSESNPWLSLVAEFLLQRTRATQVAPVFVEFRKRFPTAKSLVVAGEAAVRAMTDRIGLHRRGSLLIEVARHVTALGGKPPEDIGALHKLTGIGMYTAAAWISLHCGKRAVIIDANVARWLSRMTGLPYNRDPRHVHWVQQLADRLTPYRVYRDYNYAALDFTMAICTPRIPMCSRCPLRNDCLFFRKSGSARGSPC